MAPRKKKAPSSPPATEGDILMIKEKEIETLTRVKEKQMQDIAYLYHTLKKVGGLFERDRAKFEEILEDQKSELEDLKAQNLELKKRLIVADPNVVQRAERELEDLKAQNLELKKRLIVADPNVVQRAERELEDLKAQNLELKKRLIVADPNVVQRAERELEDQKATILELKKRLIDADSKIVEGEKLRKQLHNTIMELKGNIRVFCRVRPLLSDGVGNDSKVVSFPTSLERQGRGIDLAHNGQIHTFTYDKVFQPDDSQQDVFVEISQLVQSALDGYKVCIFAYGQTGSGKTYTMMGKPGQTHHKGMIARALEHVFVSRKIFEAQGWKYEMEVSMLEISMPEIHNEKIRDLLAPSRSENAGKQYAIRHDANGNTHVSDLMVKDVRSSEKVLNLLERAAQSRSVGKTQMNEESSRSHFVITLRIVGTNESTDQRVQGVLNLIDLAGTHRLSKSGEPDDLVKETKAINDSLTSLSDVIFALENKAEHVPFRNSKLTSLLQPCLGGASKTLMFVNVSPDPSSAAESLCSLQFAASVNACEIGTVKNIF